MMEEPGDWYTEPVRRDLLHSLRHRGVLFKGESRYQKIEIIDTEAFGKTLVLDGKTQSSADDEFIYHETLVHPALICHPAPKAVFIAGGAEGATLREVLAYHSVDCVQMVDLDQELVDLCRQHLPEWHLGAFDDPRTELFGGDAAMHLSQQPPGTYDVIIMDITDPTAGGPSVELFTQDFYKMAFDRLSPQGLFVTQAGPTSLGMADAFTAIANTMEAESHSCYEYATEIPSFGGSWGFVLGTRDGNMDSLSPTEIDLRIIDRIDKDLKFYDGICHRGLFNLPKWIREKCVDEVRVIGKDNPVYID